MWIEYENKIYDIGNMYNMRTLPMTHLLDPPQYVKNVLRVLIEKL